MQIPQNLFQFANQKALVVVAASREAKIYLASDGQIDLLGEIKIPKDEFADKGGVFKAVKGFFSVGEKKQLGLNRNYAQQLEKSVKVFLQQYGVEKLYLLAPQQDLTEISALMPIRPQKQISGNFAHEHPIRLIELIFA